MSKKISLIIAIAFTGASGFCQQLKPYQNPKLPVAVRVKDLLSRMTLQEKIAQTWCIDAEHYLNDSHTAMLTTKADSLFKNGMGEMTTPGLMGNSKNAVLLANAFQKYFIEKTRLGIPVIIHQESLHGSLANDATVFPSVLGMASSFDRELMHDVYTEVAKEVRVRGSRLVLAPVVDIVRDPRWGRTEETMGEDPFLTSSLAVEVVKAYQGKGEYLDNEHVASTLKHFGVHGWNEGGVNVSPANTDERTIRSFFFPSFKACVQQAAVMNVMPCYNEWSGMPWHANSKMLNNVLRNEWGFKGVIVSDYGGITDLHDIHMVAKDNKEAAIRAFNATVDIETPDSKAYKFLPELIKSGTIRMSQLDEAVSRILTNKFRLGLFDHPYDDPEKVARVLDDPKNQQLALKAADESMVLLKNSNSLFPLNPDKVKTIALIGPNADSCLLGGYSTRSSHTISPLQALRARYGDRIKIIYSEGVRIIDNGNWWDDKFTLSSADENKKRIAAAVEVARQADVVILCLGEHPVLSREAWSKTHLGDLTSLDLPAQQNELVEQLSLLGKPMGAFIFSGPPLSFTTINKKLSSIVQCWYLGEQTGNAVADVLFGKYNPSGKLTISIPRSTGHLPVYYNHQPSARRGYNLDTIAPLYSFGYGLSYTRFKYSNLKLSKSRININGTTTASIDLSNAGPVAGTEVVQMYIHEKYGSIARPVVELKGFQRVSLEPGQTKHLTFTITPESLKFYNTDLSYKVEPGDYEIMIGTSSIETSKADLQVTDK
jgi:beta-glucosidase